MSQGTGLGAALGALSAEVAQSWRRSAAYGLSPGQSLNDLPESSVELDSALRQAALPLIEKAAADLDSDGYVFLLADQDARLIDRFGRPSKFHRVLEEHSVRRGVLFNEESAGTNALGMALDLRRQVCVRSGEHYVEALRPVACVGQPVIHPITRRALGVLNLTGDDTVTQPLARRLVRDFVAEIEQRILERSSRAQVNLLTAFRTASARRHRPVVALDDDVVLANRSALDLLQTDDFGALQGLLVDSGTSTVDDARMNLRLANGAVADVQVERVEGTRRGLLFSLHCAEPGELVLPRSATPVATSPVTVTAPPVPTALRVAAPTAPRPTQPAESVLISGPPASGRSTAAHDLAQGRTVVTVDIGLALHDNGAPWLEALTDACRQSPTETLVLVEEIGLLP
ncbi:hypothetical protein, partial [Kribbia dieselivorans]|uniref:hypothetical protein n=1 Tax=Kribbia dieselivorans TaxID=331526 RepID=UPI000838208B